MVRQISAQKDTPAAQTEYCEIRAGHGREYIWFLKRKQDVEKILCNGRTKMTEEKKPEGPFSLVMQESTSSQRHRTQVTVSTCLFKTWTDWQNKDKIHLSLRVKISQKGTKIDKIMLVKEQKESKTNAWKFNLFKCIHILKPNVFTITFQFTIIGFVDTLCIQSRRISMVMLRSHDQTLLLTFPGFPAAQQLRWSAQFHRRTCRSNRNYKTHNSKHKAHNWRGFLPTLCSF